MPGLHIVEVELVEGNFVGIRLSDDSVFLLTAEDILSFDLPRYTLLPHDGSEVQVK